MMKQNLTKKCHKQIIKVIVCETNACVLNYYGTNKHGLLHKIHQTIQTNGFMLCNSLKLYKRWSAANE